MSSKSTHKCYFGCENDAPMHKFPRFKHSNEEKFMAWKAVLDEATQNRGNNYIYFSVRICGDHFENCYKSASRRLTPNAIPTLNLQYCGKKMAPDDSDGISTCDFQDLSDEASILQELDMSQYEDLKVQEIKKTYRKKPPRTLQKLNNKVNSPNKQMKLPVKLEESGSFLNYIEKIPASVKTYTKLLLKKRKKLCGRKFSLEEKVMAITIYQQNPKAYDTLKTMFVLPPKRLLQKVLNKFALRQKNKFPL